MIALLTDLCRTVLQLYKMHIAAIIGMIELTTGCCSCYCDQLNTEHRLKIE